VSGKAVRDALFLTSLDLTALPTMLLATSVCSIVLVIANARAQRRLLPSTWVPATFVASGLLFLVESLLRSHAPIAVAIAVYLHISAAGPILASGIWLIASARFDPHTAKKRYGQIAAAGTLGGLVSALAAERIAAAFGTPAMLPVLAVLQCGSGCLVLATWGSETVFLPNTAENGSRCPAPSALRVLRDAPYLRNLAALVL